MVLFWFFSAYSFLGYGLEKAYARLTRSSRQTRKGFLLLPLCPVYGLAMMALLAMPPTLRIGWALPVTGAVVCTAVEYAVHWFYDAVFSVRFWDYSGVPGNWRGRVCLPFSLAWGLLSALAVLWVQPLVEAAALVLPPLAGYGLLLLLTADVLLSSQLLYRTHDTELLSLRRLRRVFSDPR